MGGPRVAPSLEGVKERCHHYHLDWTVVSRDGPRFENLVATHLLKWVHHAQDVRGRDVELRYFRDTDGREVDFAVLEGRRLRTVVECKWDDAEVTEASDT